jgi:hypothetical protein
MAASASSLAGGPNPCHNTIGGAETWAGTRTLAGTPASSIAIDRTAFVDAAGVHIPAAAGGDANAKAGKTNENAAISNGTRRTRNPLEETGRTLQRRSRMLADPIVMLTSIRAELDVYAPERVADALFRPEVRAAYRNLLAQGWTDTLRALHPDDRIYTFGKYLRNEFARDAGLRIDHILLSPAAARRLQSAGVDRDVRGWERTSDHAPTWVTLKEIGRTPESGL